MQTSSPGGETLVVLALAEYEKLVDQADIAKAKKVKADIIAGRDELVPAEIANRIKGENKVRVWRDYRGRRRASSPRPSPSARPASPRSRAARRKAVCRS